MKKIAIRYIMTALGCLLMAIAINAFFVQHRFLSGGISGVSIILYYLTGWPPGITSFIFNIPLFYVAWKYMNHRFFIDSVIGTVLFSAALDGTAFVQNYVNIPDQLLCCIAGGVLGGLGGALVYRSESSTGGVDIIGFLTKKYYNISVSTTNFLFDSCVMLAAVVFLGLTPVLYSMVLFFITFQATNVFMVGFDYKKQVIIVSTHAEEIGPRVMNEVNRGITILHGEGGYTRKPLEILLVVVKLTQLAHLEKIIKEVDPMAFVTIQDANNVFGRGFTQPNLDIDEERKLKKDCRFGDSPF
ncbi:YitT family protein [Acidaminococcus timonensis]|uniref:YitT family protein n=2 Tax=Acidaminococcus timonensis TaxID=1871002 RepID=UPI00308075C7